MRKTQQIAISEILPCAAPSIGSVSSLVEHLMNGSTVPPIHVQKTKQGYVVCDGRHRLLAHRILGRQFISARYFDHGY